jgi:hypothetical protein
MPIKIGQIIKLSLLLSQILLYSFLYLYYQPSTNTLPTSEKPNLPPNEGVSVGYAIVVGPYNPPISTQKPDINELITSFYASVLVFASAALILNKVRKGRHIPIQEKFRKVNAKLFLLRHQYMRANSSQIEIGQNNK